MLECFMFCQYLIESIWFEKKVSEALMELSGWWIKKVATNAFALDYPKPENKMKKHN